jgi:hypothetical protein
LGMALVWVAAVAATRLFSTMLFQSWAARLRDKGVVRTGEPPGPEKSFEAAVTSLEQSPADLRIFTPHAFGLRRGVAHAQ